MRENPNRQVEFSGLSLAAAPPVGHLHLELRRGVTALYGQNGVGKSRILRAISDMLSGLAQRPGWNRNGEPAVNPTPPNAMQAAYQLGGLHIRVPLTPATVVDEAWHPAFIDELAGYLEDDLQQDDRMETYPTELWAQLVYTVRTTLPWPDARDDEAEYLLRHGRWLLVPSGRELAFLCDPDSRRGLLAPRWEASDDLWRTAWRSSFGARSGDTGALYPPARLSWWQGANSGCWEVPEWPMAYGHLSTRPFLPPTPELMGMPDWPEWAAFPVVEAPRAEHPPRTLVNPPVVEDNESAVEHTVRRIATLRARPDGVWAPEEALARIGVDANAILRDLFVDPPELSGSLKGIRDWFKGDWPLEWTASVHGQPPIPVDRLGDAHRRFSSFAIQQATAPTFEQLRRDGSAFQRLSTAVIDEPERALHQLAIERLAGGLASIADYVLVASHAAMSLLSPTTATS